MGLAHKKAHIMFFYMLLKNVGIKGLYQNFAHKTHKTHIKLVLIEVGKDVFIHTYRCRQTHTYIYIYIYYYYYYLNYI